MKKRNKKRIWGTISGTAVVLVLAGGAFYMANQGNNTSGNTNTITAQSGQNTTQASGS